MSSIDLRGGVKFPTDGRAACEFGASSQARDPCDLFFDGAHANAEQAKRLIWSESRADG